MAAPVNIQTPSKSWELSLYELHRSPQNTMTAKECLHRFCSDCIVTALRSGNKECPTCRQKLVSRRSLRRDSNFDALISKIYPSRDEYEAHQRSVLERLNRLHNKEALSSSIEEGLRQQARYRFERWGPQGDTTDHDASGRVTTPLSGGGRTTATLAPTCLMTPPTSPPPRADPSAAGPSRKRPRASDEGSGPEADSGNPTPRPRHHKEGPASKIELILLSTTVNATVDHISKYLALRIALDDRQTDAEMEDRGREEGGRGEETGAAAGGGGESGGRAGNGEGSGLKTISEKHHTIYILTRGGQFSTLNGSLTLELVEEKYWKVRKPLEIHYAPTRDQQQAAPPAATAEVPPPQRDG
ncbi:hypothetical protein F7725_025585 [Dissostichus mawsoni]|uniref:RING-type E3 ubiquitin transferase n=1 Tax=Dissostichus mawsoni TaxID=36200 RepID=A0A7J5XBS4_DISMA|nr:hypothetical protein F7725_025585 [Dissostichus mawsoni]